MTSKVNPLQIIEPMTSKWRQNCSPLQIIEPLTEKTWGKGCVIFGQRKNKERNVETPLRTGIYFEWIIKQLLNSVFVGYEVFCRSWRVVSISALGLSGQHLPWYAEFFISSQPLSIIANCYSFQIFPRFWLVKMARIIQHNQLLLTKFWKNFVILNERRQKCSPLQIIELMTSKWRKKCSLLNIIEPLTEKAWGRGCVILVSKKKKQGGLFLLRYVNFCTCTLVSGLSPARINYVFWNVSGFFYR